MQLGSQMLKFGGIKRPDYYWGLCFTAEEPNVVVNMTKTGACTAVTLEYSTDGRKWLPFDADNGTTPVKLKRAGSLVYFRAGSGGNAALSHMDTRYRNFTCSGYCAVSGSVMSLLNAEEEGNDTITAEHALCGLFRNNTKITSAPSLTATTVSSYCCRLMFSGCTSLVSTPEIYATTLGSWCFLNMFSGCTRLSNAGRLRSTTLAAGCYSNMFSGCTSLAVAPQIDATIVVDSCFIAMFSGCTRLTTPPALPATTMTYRCYMGMFSGCTSLVTAPALPATTTYERCYYEMFDGCTSLVNAPALPAERVEYYSYYRMFRNCRSLVSAPDLPATSTGSSGYKEMFDGCSRLNSISVGMYSWWPNTDNWMRGVSSSGTFKCRECLGTNSTITRGASNCPTGWIVSNDVDYEEPLTFTAGQDNSTIAMAKSGSPTVTPSLRYCTFDGSSWSASAAFTPGTTTVTLANAGDKMVLFDPSGANTATASSSSAYWYFTMTGSIAASGDMTSIVREGNEGDYTFCRLFNGCTSLTSAPNLPYANVKTYAYAYMFYGCTSLTSAPVLSATTLASYCYYNMFYGCTSLASAPALSATTMSDYCYARMFYNCISLTAAPELPATVLASRCYYQMFQSCTSLVTAPELPATTLEDSCYYAMFSNCTSLASAPELPAMTLVSQCYRQMFSGCTSLTSAPSLPATTLAGSCYYQMFFNCTSLATAPALPATTLASSCYRQMFSGCTSLKQTPDLPATTANALTYVYYRMFYQCTGLERTGRITIATATGTSALAQIFYGCSNLKYIELSGMTAWSTVMSSWVNGVSASGLFMCPSALGTESTITRGVSNCPSGWTVVNIREALLWNGNGGTSYAACSNYSARGLTDASFGAWVYFPSTVPNYPFVGWASTGSWGGFSIGSWGGQFYFRGGSSSAAVTNTAVVPGKWAHVFVVKSGTSLACYVNGTNVATVTCPATLGTNVGERFKIVRGTYGDTDTQATDGGQPTVALAGVCAFNRALSASEVQSIYSNRMLVDESVAPFNNGLRLGYNLTSGIVSSQIPNEKSGGYPLTVYDEQYDSLGIQFP